MTEVTWDEANDHVPMMELVAARTSDRKLRLLLVAMARCVWERMPKGELRDAVSAAELYADGDESLSVVDDCRGRLYGWAMSAATEEQRAFFNSNDTNPVFTLARLTTYPTKMLRSLTLSNSNWRGQSSRLGTRVAELIREVFGNPFRPVAFSPNWRTDTALTLARQMYDAREFSAAPILADALQDAGCDSDDLLNHLRDTSATHVRGCWALDLVLGKE